MSKAELLRRVQALEARTPPPPSGWAIVLREVSDKALDALEVLENAREDRTIPREAGRAILCEHAPNPETFHRWMSLLETT